MAVPGFKRYHVIVGPNGQILQPASCWLVEVDVFDEKELKHAIEHGPETLGKVMDRFDAEDLAPVVREGLGESLKPQTVRTAEAVGKIWRQERPALERIGEIVCDVSVEDLIRAVLDLSAKADR